MRFDQPEAHPIEGVPDGLFEEWQKKLALMFANGKIEPLYSIPEVTRSNSDPASSSIVPRNLSGEQETPAKVEDLLGPVLEVDSSGFQCNKVSYNDPGM